MRIRKIAVWFIICVIILLITASWLADKWIQTSDLPICRTITDICKFVVRSESEKCGTTSIQLGLMEFFYLIWGLPITIVLFLAEFGNEYYCGVTLKQIFTLSLGRILPVVGTILYISLCPLVYISAIQNKIVTCVCGVGSTFFLFVYILVFVFFTVQDKRIVSMLRVSTIYRLEKKISSEARRDKIKDMALKYKRVLLKKLKWEGLKRRVYESKILNRKRKKEVMSLQGFIEGLPIVDMIRYIDYNNADMVATLIKTLTETVKGKKSCASIIENTAFKSVLVMVWVECIVEASGLNTISERTRTTFILRRLYESLTEEDKDNQSNTQKRNKSYIIEILIPLLKKGTEDTLEVFESLWRNVLFERTDLVIYLLLYEHYFYCKCQKWRTNHCIISCINTMNKKTFAMAATAWEKEMAWQFWSSWTMLTEMGNNMGLKYFFDFCNDVELISKGQTQGVQTYTLGRYCWKMEGK